MRGRIWGQTLGWLVPRLERVAAILAVAGCPGTPQQDQPAPGVWRTRYCTRRGTSRLDHNLDQVIDT